MIYGRYEDIPHFSRETALIEIESSDASRVLNGLLSLALNDSDWKWVQEKCLDFCTHSDNRIKGIALLCFGHLARLHGQLDLDRVLPIVKIYLEDTDESVRGNAHNALDDINWFILNRDS